MTHVVVPTIVILSETVILSATKDLKVKYYRHTLPFLWVRAYNTLVWQVGLTEKTCPYSYK